MSKKMPSDRKFWLQTIVLCLILLPAPVLYQTVRADLQWATWILMVLISGGMVMGIRFS
jgi:hypothetical protein